MIVIETKIFKDKHQLLMLANIVNFIFDYLVVDFQSISR
jgi:hypothetical protein